MQAASRSWEKARRQILPSEPPEEPANKPCRHFDFSPARLMTDFWPPELEENKFVLFEATKCVKIGYSSNRERRQRERG